MKIDIDIYKEKDQIQSLIIGDLITYNDNIGVVTRVNEFTYTMFFFKSRELITTPVAAVKPFYGSITITCKRD